MTLLDIKAGAEAKVFAIHGGRHFVERLNSFGFYDGVAIKLIRAAPFHGPLLIENIESGARIMVGRGMAAKIEIRNDQEPAER